MTAKAKTTSEPQEDPNALPLTPELENVDITAVYRKGSIHTNFVVIFKRKDKDLILYIKPQLDKTRNELEKTLKTFSKNKVLVSDLRVALEGYIIEHLDQIRGIGSNTESQEASELIDDNLNLFDRYRDLDPNDQLLDYQEVTVREAAEMHEGKIKFTCRINTVFPEIIKQTIESNWICRGCGHINNIPFQNLLEVPGSPKKCALCSQSDKGFDSKPEIMNARLIKVESDDVNLEQSLLSLRIYLLDKYALDTHYSSRITVYGQIENVYDSRVKYSISYVIAKRVLYHDRQTLQLQPEDIPKILELSKSPNLIKALVNLFATHLKDFEFEKSLIILATIGAPTLRNQITGEVIQRGPLNILFIGPPGGGKSALAGSAKYLILRSKEIHGENTTKATLCGTVISEDGKRVIVPGVAVLASGSILVLDELDKTSGNIHDGLLEMTEKCKITIAIYGKHITFDAEVALIATANPRDENWGNKRKLELSDIPLSDRIISRFDFIIPIREFNKKEEYLDYGNFILNRTAESISVDPELLMKYIEYAHQIKSVEFSPEAKDRINDYAPECAVNKDLAYIASKRVIHTIHRICGAFARSRLSSYIDIEMVEASS